MGADLLTYRPWRGQYREPLASVWPIAAVALRMIFRRKLFWALYGLGLMIFLLFFFGQYAPAPRLLAFSLAAHLTFPLTRALLGVVWLPVAYRDLTGGFEKGHERVMIGSPAVVSSRIFSNKSRTPGSTPSIFFLPPPTRLTRPSPGLTSFPPLPNSSTAFVIVNFGSTIMTVGSVAGLVAIVVAPFVPSL